MMINVTLQELTPFFAVEQVDDKGKVRYYADCVR
jgi:hypothetical protein